MKKEIVNLIFLLPIHGLYTIPNPSVEHPDNGLYYEMKAKRIIDIKDTEESGIFAVGLTDYGRKLQKELRNK